MSAAGGDATRAVDTAKADAAGLPKAFAAYGRLRTFGLRLVVIAAMLGLWQLCSDTGVIDDFFVSSPSRVGARVWDFTVDGSIFRHSYVTLMEAIKGYAAGVVFGVVVGFALGLSKILGEVFLPILNLLNTLPRIALAPLFILWFGIDEMSKIVLVFTVVIVIIIFNTYAGTQTVDRDILTNARLLGASRLQTVLKITLPSCLPWILAGMRVALAWSIGAAVVGEYLASREGLGYLIFFYSGAFDQTGLLAGCAVLLVISGVLFALLGLLERRLLRWRPAGL